MTPRQKDSVSALTEILKHPLVTAFILAGIVLYGNSLIMKEQIKANRTLINEKFQQLNIKLSSVDMEMTHLRTDLNLWYNEHIQFKDYLTTHKHNSGGEPYVTDAWPPSKRSN